MVRCVFVRCVLHRHCLATQSAARLWRTHVTSSHSRASRLPLSRASPSQFLVATPAPVPAPLPSPHPMRITLVALFHANRASRISLLHAARISQNSPAPCPCPFTLGTQVIAAPNHNAAVPATLVAQRHVGAGGDAQQKQTPSTGDVPRRPEERPKTPSRMR